jgi:hypothetical protein
MFLGSSLRHPHIDARRQYDFESDAPRSRPTRPLLENRTAVFVSRILSGGPTLRPETLSPWTTLYSNNGAHRQHSLPAIKALIDIIIHRVKDRNSILKKVFSNTSLLDYAPMEMYVERDLARENKSIS